MQQMGYRSDTSRIVFLAIGATLFLFSPLVIIMGPMLVPVTFFYEKYTWVYYTPTSSYKLYIAATAAIVIGCFLFFFFSYKKWTITLSTLLFAIALVFYIAGAFSYMKLTPEGIKYREAFQWEESVYKWSEIEQVRYFPLIEYESGRPIYEVTFKDGVIFEFEETEDVSIARGNILSMLKMNDVTYVNMHSEKSKQYDENKK